MKRSPLKRGKPLRADPAKVRAWQQRTRKAIKPRPNPAKDAAWRRARTDVRARSGGRCEGRVEGVCTIKAEHVHHLRLRSQGGKDEPANLADLCAACHQWAHANPREASERGLIWRTGA